MTPLTDTFRSRNGVERKVLKVIPGSLKDPCQSPPFSMLSKLLILHGEARSSQSFVFLEVFFSHL